MKIDEIKSLPQKGELPYEPYIVISIDEELLSKIHNSDLLTEGGWRPSGIGDLWYRVNSAKPQMGHPANVHIAHQKHLAAKDKQVSWEASQGKRHDKLTFDLTFSPMEKAKKVARTALKLPSDFFLEQLTSSNELAVITESVAHLSECIYLVAMDNDSSFDEVHADLGLI